MKKVKIRSFVGADVDVTEFDLDELLNEGIVETEDNKGWKQVITLED